MRLEAMAMRLEAIASWLEAIAIRLEAIASRLEAIAIRLEAIASRLQAITFIGFLEVSFLPEQSSPTLADNPAPEQSSLPFEPPLREARFTDPGGIVKENPCARQFRTSTSNGPKATIFKSG